MDDEAFADPYVYPGTQVLQNLFGARDLARLEAFEYRATFIRRTEFVAQPVTGQFDLGQLRETHRRLFQDVYRWAGQLRTVEITKGTSKFHHSAYIEIAAQDTFAWLAESDLLNPAIDDQNFIVQASDLLEKINYIHPFRDGNGRAQRAFLEQVAEVSGRSLAWRNISQREHTLASIRAFQQSSGEPFRELMGEVMKPPVDGLDPLEPSVYRVTPRNS